MQKGDIITLQQRRYSLQKSLARGGQGTIWKVVGDDDKEYALKVVNRYKIESSRRTLHTREEMARLIYYTNAEIEFLNSLDNSLIQHIVICLDSGTVTEEGYDLPAFIMPFYQQEDLSMRIKSFQDKKQPIDARLWLRWFRQLMLALQSIQMASGNHKLLVHRDIKPSNCLLSDKDDLLLIDFGIVRESSKTGTTSIVYSYDYCAPEQRLACYESKAGAPHYYITPAVDIYSAAVVIHEIVGGGTRAQKELNKNTTKRLHDRALHDALRKQNKAKTGELGKVGGLGQVGGLTEKEQLNLQQILTDLFTPIKNGKTIALHHPALPNYNEIANDTTELLANMLSPWPDDRPNAGTVLKQLDAIETALQPELQHFKFNKEKYTVFIGQTLVVELEIKGKGLPKDFNWLQIRLNQDPLYKPQINTVKEGLLQVELPVFSELHPHKLRLSTQLFGQNYCDDALIEVLPDANYLWTMGQRLEALKLELRAEWLNQWEAEAKNVVKKFPLLEALEALQQEHPKQASKLQQRYARINTPVIEPPSFSIKKILIGIGALVLFATVTGVAINHSLDIDIFAEPKVILPSLSYIELGFQSKKLDEQREAWRKLNDIIIHNKNYAKALKLKEKYENETAKWNAKDQKKIIRNQALLRLRAMANEGEAQAQYWLALRYLQGDEVTYDLKKGKYWTKKAAEQGVNNAIKTLKELKELKGK